MFFNVFLAIILFTLPGVVSEMYYLALEDKRFSDNIGLSIVRSLCFCLVILLFRCAISIARGYGELQIQELFMGIGNVLKYILLSGVLALLLPNAYLLINNIYCKIMSKLVK